MPNATIQIQKEIINKLRETTNNIITTINGKTYANNDGFKFFASEIIYSKLEQTFLDGFNKGFLSGQKLL